MRYLLDTTVLLDHVNGYRPAVALLLRLIDEDGELLTCDIVACEALSTGTDAQRDVIERLLGALDYVPTPASAAHAGGDARRGTGGRLSLADSLIGALAVELDATIVTRNRPGYELLGASVLTY
jgi:predicted nucleic acid-binding protein